MNPVPNAKLCHQCQENYVGRHCPKCTPKAVLCGRLQAERFVTEPERDGFEATASVAAPPAPPKATLGMSAPALVLRLTGEVRGGKNSMGVTKTGKHYARPAFKTWRTVMLAEILSQLPYDFVCITRPANLCIEYIAGDQKRRDQTGIFDALFHLLEYAQVVTDDSLLWVTESSRSYAKANPGVVITFL